MSMWTRKEWKSVNDIENRVRLSLRQKTPIALRESVQMVVIDDQPFEPATNLSNNHYKINHLTDVHSVSSIASYPIVLCDLQGVGTQLNTDMQGAHLIREIKNNFPEKIVIAYTGGARSSAMAKAAQTHADAFLKKDADIDEWVEALDAAINKVVDPLHTWREYRKRLLDAGATPFQVTQLEDAFVENFWSGAGAVKSKFRVKLDTLGLASDIKSIALNFISSVIFDAVTG